MKYFWLFLCLFITNIFVAQTKIKGQIIDFDSKVPIAFAAITYNNTKFNADWEGKFSVEIKDYKLPIKVNFKGYYEKIIYPEVNFDLQLYEEEGSSGSENPTEEPTTPVEVPVEETPTETAPIEESIIPVEETPVEVTPESFSEQFNDNKKALGNTMPSKKIKNKIAGYITRLKRNTQKLIPEN
jgi:ribosomal protein S17E